MSSRLRAIVLQLQSIDHVQSNLDQIASLLEGVARAEEPGLVCLPENALYMRIKEGEPIQGLNLDSAVFESFKKWSQELNLVFHVGSVPIEWLGKLVNSSVMIWPDGRVGASYQKIHLFDIHLEGHPAIRESDVFHQGSKPETFLHEDWKWGQTICYDLRFAELFSQYAKEQIDGVLVPAAFLKPTGEAHWHVLLRARAIESQVFVIAAAQAGVHRSANGQRQTYGHSLVIDPWGKILAEGSADQPERLEVELDRSLVERVRRQIPMSHHRRHL